MLSAACSTTVRPSRITASRVDAESWARPPAWPATSAASCGTVSTGTQGSTAYLNDLLHRDVKLRGYLAQHPEVARDLAEGKIQIEYKPVRARPSGTIGVSTFTLDQDALHLGDLGDTVGVRR